MNIRFLTLAIAVMLIALPIAMAGKDCSSCTIYKGYVTGDMELWKKGMHDLQQSYDRNPDACTLYTLAEARYGYIGYLLGTGDKSSARSVLDTFEKDLELLAIFPEYMAETEAFRISLLGFRIGLNPARAVILGPKALKQLETAMQKGSGSATVWIEKANSEAHMPPFVGGSKEKAAASFREALRLYETGGELSGCNWRYLNTIVLLGQLLENMDDWQGAREAYRRALKREPDFEWVRDELLPAVEEKIKNL